MVRAEVQFTDEQIHALRLLSAQQKKSMEDLVRESVDMLLREQRRTSVVQRALKAAGKFISGKRDISSNHDDYLAKAYEDRGA
jgi:hypothetical protein